jgi:PAS domain S-box-containing protein
MGDPIHVIDIDFNILLMNRAFYSWIAELGLSEDIIGRSVFDVFPFLTEKVRDEYNGVFRTGTTLVTEESTKLNGREYITETRKIPIIDGGFVTRIVSVVRDITDRKRAEEKLRESEARLRTAVESLPFDFFIIDEDGRYTMQNTTCRNHWGELIGKRPDEVAADPETVNVWLKNNRRAFAGEIVRGEVDLTINGEKHHFYNIISPIYDHGIQGILGVNIDITDRKQAEQKLRESEARNMAILNAIPDLMFRISREGIFIDYKTARPQDLALLPDEFLGRSISEVMPEAFGAETLHHMERALDSGCLQVFEYRLPVPLPDGELRSFEARIMVSGENEVLIIVRDITDRKRAEEKLRESEARYRAVVEDQTELICRFRSDGVLTFVNDAYCRYFEKSRADLLGKTFMPYIVDDDREMVQRQFHFIGKDHPIETHEQRIVAPNGEVRWQQWTNRGIFDEDGQVIEYQAVGRDITDRKRAETEIERSLEEKDVLLKEIHHRVKNNLQVISGLLLLQSREIADERTIRMLEECQNRIKSMARIHERLYRTGDLARINFGDYIRDVGRDLIRSSGLDSRRIVLDIQTEDIYLSVNTAIPCGLIINELLSNAIKHAFPGRRQGRVEISFRKELQGTLKLVVKDNGVGFPEHIDFRRTSTLGLQLVNTLTEQLEGKISMQRDGGTVITVAFVPGELDRV